MITVDGKKSFDLSSVQYFPAQQKSNRNLRCDTILLSKTKLEQGINSLESPTALLNKYLPCRLSFFGKIILRIRRAMDNGGFFLQISR